jgi:hypothetical protein
MKIKQNDQVNMLLLWGGGLYCNIISVNNFMDKTGVAQLVKKFPIIY